MYIEQLVFIVSSAALIGCALMMVIAKNTVHSALFLVMCFVASAVLWILLEAEFLALILIFVYVGAVMTLFLFVIMLLNLDIISREKGMFVRFLPIGIVLILGMLAMMVYVISPEHFGHLVPVHESADYSNIKELGMVLYTQYVYPLEAAAALLLVAIIAAVGLTFRGKAHRKAQNINEQLLVKKEDRLTILKMPSEGKEE